MKIGVEGAGVIFMYGKAQGGCGPHSLDHDRPDPVT